METQLRDRLAVLETKMDMSREDRAKIHMAIEHVRRDVDEVKTDNMERMNEIMDKINQIDNKLSKYTGFWGGIVMVAGAVWSFFALFWKSIQLKFGLGS